MNINQITLYNQTNTSTDTSLEPQAEDTVSPVSEDVKVPLITGTEPAVVTSTPDVAESEPIYDDLSDEDALTVSESNLNYLFALLLFVAIGALLWCGARSRFMVRMRRGSVSKGKYKRVDDDIEKQRA